MHLVPADALLHAGQLAEFIRTHRLTQWFSVPSALVWLHRFDAVRAGDFPELRELSWCGEVLPTPTLQWLMQRLPQYITTIPGVGAVTGATILAEIGDVQRFAEPEKLVAFAGVDPVVYQTGQFEASNTRTSKRGSPSLRHALWQAAFAASRFDPQLRDYYQRNPDIAEGMVRGYLEGVAAVGQQKERALQVIHKYTRLQDPKLLQELYVDGVKFLERVPRMDAEALNPIVAFMGKKPIPVESIADNSIVNRLERDGFIDKLYGKR